LNDALLLEKLYTNKILLNEISKSYVDAVKDAVYDKELPFNNIFGDKLRIVIPIAGTQTYTEIRKAITAIPNYSGFDPQKKEVIKTVKLDPKYGGGEKEQRINLGKAISSLKLPEDQKKKYLNWFAAFNSNIPEIEDYQKYSIVISRNPVDVLRMSDAGNIHSCHSQGGSYFHCAIQEAKTGGPIAFLVNTEDIEPLSEEELQDDEIFEDDERDVNGIHPLGRIRIRRYFNTETEESIAIPEVRIYGSRIAGFYDTVKEFFKTHQSNLDATTIYKQFQNSELIRTGGSYTDSSDSELFNTMFDTDKFRGSVEHEENEEGADRTTQYEQELGEFHNRFCSDLQHSHCDFEVLDDGGEVYYNAWAYIKINIGDIILTDEFESIEITDHYDIRSILDYDASSEYAWKKRIPYEFNNNPKEILKYKHFLELFELYDTSAFVADGLGGIRFEDNTNIILDIYTDDEMGHNTDDYAYYCRNVSEIDAKYSKIRFALIRALVESGYTEENENSEDFKSIDTEKDNINQLEEFINSLKNFEYDENKHNFTTDIFVIKANDKIERAFYDTQGMFGGTHRGDEKTDIGKFFEKYLKLHFKFSKPDTTQLSFKQFAESYKSPILNEYGISIDFTISRNRQDQEIHGILTIQLENPIINKKNKEVISFLDSHFADISNAIKLVVLQAFKIYNDYTKNLEKVYGKYFN